MKNAETIKLSDVAFRAMVYCLEEKEFNTLKDAFEYLVEFNYKRDIGEAKYSLEQCEKHAHKNEKNMRRLERAKKLYRNITSEEGSKKHKKELYRIIQEAYYRSFEEKPEGNEDWLRGSMSTTEELFYENYDANDELADLEDLEEKISDSAATMGRKGGKSKSAAKKAAVKLNLENACEGLTPEEKSKRSKKIHSAMTPEKRKERSMKAVKGKWNKKMYKFKKADNEQERYLVDNAFGEYGRQFMTGKEYNNTIIPLIAEAKTEAEVEECIPSAENFQQWYDCFRNDIKVSEAEALALWNNCKTGEEFCTKCGLEN